MNESVNKWVLVCAERAYEATRAYSAMLGNDKPPWCEAQEWQVSSCVACVAAATVSHNISPMEAHREWLDTARWPDHKALDGWLWDEAKDSGKVPYLNLSVEQRFKVTIFLCTVRACVAVDPFYENFTSSNFAWARPLADGGGRGYVE